MKIMAYIFVIYNPQLSKKIRPIRFAFPFSSTCFFFSEAVDYFFRLYLSVSLWYFVRVSHLFRFFTNWQRLKNCCFRHGVNIGISRILDQFLAVKNQKSLIFQQKYKYISSYWLTYIRWVKLLQYFRGVFFFCTLIKIYNSSLFQNRCNSTWICKMKPYQLLFIFD